MDVGLLEQIVKLMAANDLNTVDLRDGDKRVILKRGASSWPRSAKLRRVRAAARAPPSTAPAPHRRRTLRPAATGARCRRRRGTRPDQEPDGRHVLRRAQARTPSRSSPSAATVDEETDVCIIEAMKVFNNIKAETAARSRRSWCSNGQTVEFGQPLFLVKP